MPVELQAVNLQVAGSNPAGSKCGPVAQRIEQDARATGQDVSPNLVVMTRTKDKATSRGECRKELQRNWDALQGSTPDLQAPSGMGGTSHSFSNLVAAASR